MSTKENTAQSRTVKRLFVALAVSGLLLAGAAQAQFSMPITFTNLVGRGTLTNFPALVKLTPGNTVNYTGFLDTTYGWDLRFWTNSSLTGTELHYEIETFGTNGTSSIWVQVPALTQNSSIWASWGDVANTNQQAYTTNGAVWADYHAVYHLNGTDGSGKWPDSSGNGAHLTAYGSTVTEVAGLAGGGAQMDGRVGDTSERLTYVIAGAPSYNQWTVTLFAKARNATGDDVRQYVGVFNNRGISTNSFQIDFDASSSYQYRGVGGSVAIGAPATTWQMIAVSQDASAPLTQTFFNGQPVASGAIANNEFGQFSIGNNRNADGAFAGIVDEVRISSVKRSSNWIWACHMNISTEHNNFVSYGSVLAPSLPSVFRFR